MNRRNFLLGTLALSSPQGAWPVQPVASPRWHALTITGLAEPEEQASFSVLAMGPGATHAVSLAQRDLITLNAPLRIEEVANTDLSRAVRGRDCALLVIDCSIDPRTAIPLINRLPLQPDQLRFALLWDQSHTVNGAIFVSALLEAGWMPIVAEYGDITQKTVGILHSIIRPMYGPQLVPVDFADLRAFWLRGRSSYGRVIFLPGTDALNWVFVKGDDADLWVSICCDRSATLKFVDQVMHAVSPLAGEMGHIRYGVYPVPEGPEDMRGVYIVQAPRHS